MIELDLPFLLRRGWLILRHLPLLSCPLCEGAGGAMVGYEEPEWSECYFCWDGWKDLDDYGLQWFIGRINPLRWPKSKLILATGHHSFRGWVLCRLGRHAHFHGFCARCYEPCAEPCSITRLEFPR